MRVFLDANILFSAAKTDGPIATLVRPLVDAGHECVVDGFVTIEARRNLTAKYPNAIEGFERLIATCTTIATPAMAATSLPGLDWLPAKDQPVLAAAIRGRCQVLVTGDRKHFGPGYGRTFGGVAIHSPRSLYLLISA